MSKSNQPSAFVVMFDSTGRFLALREKDDWWSLPGGRVEYEDGECCIKGALREVREETGIRLTASQLVLCGAATTKSGRPVLVFRCEVGKQRKVTLSHEHDEYAWLSRYCSPEQGTRRYIELARAHRRAALA